MKISVNNSLFRVETMISEPHSHRLQIGQQMGDREITAHHPAATSKQESEQRLWRFTGHKAWVQGHGGMKDARVTHQQG